MTTAVVLLSYAAVVAMVGPWMLLTGGWSDRAPRLAIIAWQCLTVSVVAAVALAGVALLIPTASVSGGLAELLRACAMALSAQYSSPGGAAAAATGAILMTAVLGRLAWCLTAVLTDARRRRSRHRTTLDLVGTTVPGLDAVVLSADRPAVYCLPGRHRRIVVTSGALQLLTEEQLTLVLRHEQAHARQRHDLVLAWSQTTAKAFPRVPLFATARAESARLVELLADDVAIGHDGNPLALADALLTLSSAPAPVAALAAGGSTAGARVRRLINPRRPLGRLGGALTAAAALGMLLLPVAVAVGPAASATRMDYCPMAAPSVAASTPSAAG